MATTRFARSLLLSLTIAVSALPAVAALPTQPVDLVICLDTSRSMDALLDSARGRIWDIVNTLARMRPTPELRVGLVTYGSPNVAAAEDGFVALRTDLTGDLDAVYSQLMALETDGGDEYVGAALDRAIRSMSWSGDPDALRVMFVAGNESADQGSGFVTLETVGEQAIDHDIIINAIYAGKRSQGIIEKWPWVAQYGGGSFSSIDPVTGTTQLATPQDQALLDLNANLNATYVAYGAQGRAGLTNQIAQDANATRLGTQTCSSRIAAKGTALYSNAWWDLVDAHTENHEILAELGTSDLPELMRPMSADEQVEYLGRKRSEREHIQTKIQGLFLERETFIRATLEKQNAGLASLDDAMRRALLEQAKKKGFECDGC